MLKKSLILLSLALSFSLISSCRYMGKKACYGKKARAEGNKSCCGKASLAGQAELAGLANGSKIKGSVSFEKTGRRAIKVNASFKGLEPNKKFGFHIHEFGNCANKGLLAGGHLNPYGKKHGGAKSKERHLGDLGNLESDAKGRAIYSMLVKGKLKKVLGRAVIVHAKPDDLKSQPAGNAGNRLACGVIVAAMPPALPEKKPKPAKKTQTAPAGGQTSLIDKNLETQKVSTGAAPAPETKKNPPAQAPAAGEQPSASSGQTSAAKQPPASSGQTGAAKQPPASSGQTGAAKQPSADSGSEEQTSAAKQQ